MPSVPPIHLVPVGAITAGDLAPLQPAAAGLFGAPVQIHAGGEFEAGGAFDPRRGQADASKLLLGLLARFRDEPGKIVGVTELDLFAPGQSWIFGQAQVQGRAAIVSLCRLTERFYGRPANPELERLRLVTELSHELGHAFGLIHCDLPRCLMSWSASVEQIEAKGLRLCAACAERLARLAPQIRRDAGGLPAA